MSTAKTVNGVPKNAVQFWKPPSQPRGSFAANVNRPPKPPKWERFGTRPRPPRPKRRAKQPLPNRRLQPLKLPAPASAYKLPSFDPVSFKSVPNTRMAFQRFTTPSQIALSEAINGIPADQTRILVNGQPWGEVRGPAVIDHPTKILAPMRWMRKFNVATELVYTMFNMIPVGIPKEWISEFHYGKVEMSNEGVRNNYALAPISYFRGAPDRIDQTNRLAAANIRFNERNTFRAAIIQMQQVFYNPTYSLGPLPLWTGDYNLNPFNPSTYNNVPYMVPMPTPPNSFNYYDYVYDYNTQTWSYQFDSWAYSMAYNDYISQVNLWNINYYNWTVSQQTLANELYAQQLAAYEEEQAEYISFSKKVQGVQAVLSQGIKTAKHQRRHNQYKNQRHDTKHSSDWLPIYNHWLARVGRIYGTPSEHYDAFKALMTGFVDRDGNSVQFELSKTHKVFEGWIDGVYEFDLERALTAYAMEKTVDRIYGMEGKAKKRFYEAFNLMPKLNFSTVGTFNMAYYDPKSGIFKDSGIPTSYIDMSILMKKLHNPNTPNTAAWDRYKEHWSYKSVFQNKFWDKYTSMLFGVKERPIVPIVPKAGSLKTYWQNTDWIYGDPILGMFNDRTYDH